MDVDWEEATACASRARASARISPGNRGRALRFEGGIFAIGALRERAPGSRRTVSLRWEARSFTAPRSSTSGTRCAFPGRSGAGKTTLSTKCREEGLLVPLGRAERGVPGP